jgi:hypothetical protein
MYMRTWYVTVNFHEARWAFISSLLIFIGCVIQYFNGACVWSSWLSIAFLPYIKIWLSSLLCQDISSPSDSRQ